MQQPEIKPVILMWRFENLQVSKYGKPGFAFDNPHVTVCQCRQDGDNEVLWKWLLLCCVYLHTGSQYRGAIIEHTWFGNQLDIMHSLHWHSCRWAAGTQSISSPCILFWSSLHMHVCIHSPHVCASGFYADESELCAYGWWSWRQLCISTCSSPGNVYLQV